MSIITKLNRKITEELIINNKINFIADEILVFQDCNTVQAAAMVKEKKQKFCKKRKNCVSVYPIIPEKSDEGVTNNIEYDRTHLIPNYYIDNCSSDILIKWDRASNQGTIENSLKKFEEKVEKKIKDGKLEFPFYWLTSISRTESDKAKWTSCIIKEGYKQHSYYYLEISKEPYIWP